MSKRFRPAMTDSRFEDLVAAYGGDPAHWPDNERAAAEALAEGGGRAAALERARALDRALDSVAAPAPSEDLRQRVLALARRNAGTEPARRRTRARGAGWTSIWRPALFASSGLLGALAGLALAGALSLDGTIDTLDLAVVAGGAIDPGFSGMIEEVRP